MLYADITSSGSVQLGHLPFKAVPAPSATPLSQLTFWISPGCGIQHTLELIVAITLCLWATRAATRADPLFPRTTQ